jgi:hypothetical protein
MNNLPRLGRLFIKLLTPEFKFTHKNKHVMEERGWVGLFIPVSQTKKLILCLLRFRY